MALSFSWMVDVMEEKVSAFMDLMLEQRFTKKEDMIKAWNGMSSHVSAPPREPKQVETERCVFKITRGDKMGEQCPSRSKKGTPYCVKHTKDRKEDEKKVDKKEEVTEEKEVVQTEFMTSSHRLELELKKKEMKKPVEVEFETKNKFKLVKGTSIVVNSENEVIGYLDKQQLVKGTTQKMDKQIREFNLIVNRDGWPDMDE